MTRHEIGDDEMKSGIGDDEIGPDLMKFERSMADYSRVGGV